MLRSSKRHNDQPTSKGWLTPIRRLQRNEDGATAIEFGFIALPFFLLIAATIEVAMIYFAGLQLENGVDQAGRLIRTGQAQGDTTYNADKFKTDVCNHVVLLSDCTTNLVLDVQSWDKDSIGQVATDLNNSPAADADSDGEIDDMGFTMGGATDIVVVRAFYKWKLLAALPTIGLGNWGSGHRLIEGITVFRNEPF